MIHGTYTTELGEFMLVDDHDDLAKIDEEKNAAQGYAEMSKDDTGPFVLWFDGEFWCSHDTVEGYQYGAILGSPDYERYESIMSEMGRYRQFAIDTWESFND